MFGERISTMSVDATLVAQQLLALLNTLRSLPTKEKEQTPSSQYCHDANRLLEMAKEAFPDVGPGLWPTPLNPADRQSFHYVEIETFAARVLMAIQDVVITWDN